MKAAPCWARLRVLPTSGYPGTWIGLPLSDTEDLALDLSRSHVTDTAARIVKVSRTPFHMSTGIVPSWRLVLEVNMKNVQRSVGCYLATNALTTAGVLYLRFTMTVSAFRSHYCPILA